MKVATFTVRATQEQAIRWNRAAAAEGHRFAGTWLACAADAYLKVRAKAGLPLPLAWQRFGRFRVILMDGAEVEVRGVVSPPLRGGIEQGPVLTGPALLPFRRRFVRRRTLLPAGFWLVELGELAMCLLQPLLHILDVTLKV